MGATTPSAANDGFARDVVAQCSASRPQANIQLADNLQGGSQMATINFLDFSFYLALPVSLLLVLGGAWRVVRR